MAADHHRRTRFAGYQHKTDRRIPVIRLTRRSGRDGAAAG
jgi:hypothetical protein